MTRELLAAGFRLAGRCDPRLWRGLVYAAIEGVFAAAPYPLLYLLLCEAFAGHGTPKRALGYGLAMLACVALRIIAGRVGMPLVFSGAYAMMGEARLAIAEHLRKLPIGWLGRQRSGDLGARLTSDLEVVEQVWSHFLGVFVSGLAMALCLLLFLFWMDWQLTLIAWVGILLALWALARTRRALARPGARLIASNAAAQSTLLEYVEGIAVIRGFGRFGDIWRRLRAVLDEQHAAMLAVESRPAPWLAAYGLLLETGYVSLLFVSLWRIPDTLSPEALVGLVGFLVLALPLYRQLFEVGLSTLLLRFTRGALERIETILAEPALPEPILPKMPQGHAIVFENVRFAYEKDASALPVLDGVSCEIPANRLTAVVGLSGAGKSTLVHLIARLWDVDSGVIRLGGVDVREMGTDELHRHVAMVFQDVLLFSGSVLDNLRIGKPDASRAESIAAAKRAQAHDFIEALPQGYDTRLDEGGASLSGGERQRLSIARALLKDAPVLLLDEATASIDPSAEAAIQRAIAELARGRTVVVIAHRLKTVRHVDQILVLDQGRLVEQGRHDELLARGGLYARLWTCQQQARDWRLAGGADFSEIE